LYLIFASSNLLFNKITYLVLLSFTAQPPIMLVFVMTVSMVSRSTFAYPNKRILPYPNLNPNHNHNPSCNHNPDFNPNQNHNHNEASKKELGLGLELGLALALKLEKDLESLQNGGERESGEDAIRQGSGTGLS
jgi:hypothetical protein